MHFVEVNSDSIKAKWDELVRSSGASLFCESRYLDAVCVHWKILYASDESGGIACPYTIKAGVQILVTPFFHRYVEWVGETVDFEEIIKALKCEFQVADLCVKSGGNGKQYVYQLLKPGALKLNQQAKRSLKRAEHFVLKQANEFDRLYHLIEEELTLKVNTLNTSTLPLLHKLVKAYVSTCVKQWNVYDEGRWVGGLWLFDTPEVVYYVKGAVTKDVKEQGAMYRMMKQAIDEAHEQGKTFDFGGSNVAGVRRFNLNFGAEDVFYEQLTWNQAPFWWKMLRSIRRIFR